MAAGDIIIPNNTITPEIMQQIATEVEKLIGTNAKDPGQWETVQSTDGVTSLPVFKVIGNTYKLVRVAVSILQGIDGREVELRLNTDRTAIQWRYVGVSGSNLDPTEWINLVDLSLIKGDPGENPVFRKGTSGLEWKYQSESDSSWRLLVSIDDIKLHFSDLTEDEIAEFWRGVPEDVVALFQKPATDAAAEVLEQMNEITENANKAIDDICQLETTVEEQEEARVSFYAQAQIQEQNRQTKEAERQKAAEEQSAAAEEQAEAAEAHAKAEKARVLADSERDKTFTTRMQEITTATQNADTAAETAEESAKEADKQALAAKGAAADAQDTADHPTYIGADYYVYKWNKEAKAYDKTDIFVKGDAFSIKKVYPSISAMSADLDNPEIKEGDFVLINTNDVEDPDNAQLYIRTETGFRFLVDLSGAIGFTGKTPQFLIGNVSKGDEPVVSLSEDGVDDNGNPKYKLNFVLPKGDKGDIGPIGPVGPEGKQGPIGPKGDTGAAFTYDMFTPDQLALLVGPVGPVGPKGDKGDKGDTGAQGPQGLKGDTGAAGPAGKNLEFTWDGYTLGVRQQGQTAYTYSQSLRGATGATGAQGPKGDKGDTGATGPAGAKGATGATGATGPQGPKGDKGDTGARGATGPQGPQGPAGASGANWNGGTVGTNIIISRSYPTLYLRDSNSEWQIQNSPSEGVNYWYNSSQKFRVAITGNVYCAGEYSKLSDIRIKNRIKDLDNVLDKIKGLSVFYYTRTDLETEKRHLGVSAQEVIEVFPEVVSLYDELYSVDYSSLAAAVAIAGLNEVRERLEQLEQKLSA